MFSLNSAIANMPVLPTAPPESDPDRSVLDLFKLSIASQISTITSIPVNDVFAAVDTERGSLDFCVAFQRFGKAGKPGDLMDKVLAAYKTDEWIEKFETNGPGFVSFRANTSNLFRLTLGQIHGITRSPQYEDTPLHMRYGSNTTGQGKKMLIDFSSPNIAKTFHAGHLRSTLIGAFLANLYEANGWSVTRMNYLGDWGKQYGLLAVGFERYGDRALLEEEPTKHLHDVYVKINQAADADPADTSIHDEARAYFKRMEAGDPEALALWKLFRDLSIKKYESLYKRLNIRFDVYTGESQISQEGQQDALQKLEKLGVATPGFEKSVDPETKEEVVKYNDSLIVDFARAGIKKLGVCVIRKKDGTNLYITRDIAGAIEHYENYKFDKKIYVVGMAQQLHFQQLFKILEMMGHDFHKKLEHIGFGLVKGMSTRKGTAVFLEDILSDAQEAMLEKMSENDEKFAQIADTAMTSDVVGISGVKILDMYGKRGNDYEYDRNRITATEGDTGPYLQYQCCRLFSVERKVAKQTKLRSDPTQINTDLLMDNDRAREIVLLLARYPDVVRKTFKNQEPNTIVTFSFKLCRAISSAWETLIVKGSEEELAQARLLLFVVARDVLCSAMTMLTLTPLQRM